VNKAYKILHIDKLWNVPHSKWGSSKITSTGGQKNIGRYQLEGKEKEGIRLHFQTMKYNPGLRQVAKIMLNSVWGNFQVGKGRSVLQTTKGKEVGCFPYQFAWPDYPYTMPWSS